LFQACGSIFLGNNVRRKFMVFQLVWR